MQTATDSLLLKALTDLAHEAQDFLREYQGFLDDIFEFDAPNPDALEYLVGRAMHAIRKATEEDRS